MSIKWPWGHREPAPEIIEQTQDAERAVRQSRIRKAARTAESQRHLNIAETLRKVTTENHFSEHIEAAYRRRA